MCLRAGSCGVAPAPPPPAPRHALLSAAPRTLVIRARDTNGRLHHPRWPPQQRTRVQSRVLPLPLPTRRCRHMRPTMTTPTHIEGVSLSIWDTSIALHRFSDSQARNACALAAPSRSPPSRPPPLCLLAGSLGARALSRVAGREFFAFGGDFTSTSPYLHSVRFRASTHIR
ncbi:hypothetical protein FIBSPDRAFT_475880 [Athelia psychrophila]|uniref:Uncharacterized protein n=1 Tax=Athelia psychrophila TaxID=1759441 RepID=A0A166L7E4_9AGAM|nr:hypothetical protein FIBSPDRAFT_475880 [Fibularhizoctonia sp. CBS 109695]